MMSFVQGVDFSMTAGYNCTSVDEEINNQINRQNCSTVEQNKRKVVLHVQMKTALTLCQLSKLPSGFVVCLCVFVGTNPQSPFQRDLKLEP